MLSHNPEIGRCEEHFELKIILSDASIVDLPESKLAFDHPKRVLHLSPKMRFRRLNQIHQPPFCGVR